MESTNIPQDFHQEHEQQQQVESASSSSFQSSTPHGSWYNEASRYGSTHFPWSPNNNPFINNNMASRIHQNFNTQLYNTSKPYTGEKDEDEAIQIPWGNNTTEYDHHHQQNTLIPLPEQSSNKSKLDLFNSFMFPKSTDIISSSHSSIDDLQHLSPRSYLKTDNFLDTKLLRTNPALLTTPSGQPQFQAAVQFLSNSHDYSRYEGSSTSLPLIPSRGTFSQIFPSVNISNLNNTHLDSTVSSSPLDMNVQALDLLTSAGFGGGTSHDQTHRRHAIGQHQHLQLSGQRHTSPDKMPCDVQGGSATTYMKRPQTDQPRTTKISSKKSRTESRACPPFKVRKEKLGDRIAALQQLVAPFGKTDTASVLMEAIGYIKFLQNQVETLSVPYMKSSRSTRCIKPGQMMDRTENADYQGNINVESRRDLRSRGLCLVPLSCMSYVTNDDGGGWPSSDYHGET